MSITFGIYDFFSFTIPGLIYILVASQLSNFLGLPGIDLTDLSGNFGGVLLWVVFSYVVGHLMDSFAIQLYYLVNKFHAETAAMKEFKDAHKDLPIKFTINDRKTLFSVIRHNNLDLAVYIDSFKAISFMLNNISLALILFAVERLVEMVLVGFSITKLVAVALSLIFSYVAIKRSALFNKWHWAAVYQHARQYGESVAEMFKVPTKRKG